MNIEKSPTDGNTMPTMLAPIQAGINPRLEILSQNPMITCLSQENRGPSFSDLAANRRNPGSTGFRACGRPGRLADQAQGQVTGTTTITAPQPRLLRKLAREESWFWNILGCEDLGWGDPLPTKCFSPMLRAS